MHSYLEIKEFLQTPPLRRFSMVYQPSVFPQMVCSGWKKILAFRRTILLMLVLGSTWIAGTMISATLSSGGLSLLKVVIIAMFTVLFAWISITFWTALIGFFLLLKKHDALELPKLMNGKYEIPDSLRIAVVMPIYNEDIDRVFAGLQVMYESLRQTGQLERFSFFILSDSSPSQGALEEEAWGRLCARVDGVGRIFYRRRKIRIHKKSGNISDFCRRWGSHYKYMVTLDADSLMSGQLMVDMTRIMEFREDIGILQTAPKGINHQSLAARLSQFTSHLYGPLFLAGTHFVQLDETGFWGHNAIVRLEPFMKFCALPRLGSNRPPFGGEILSHDFVEAALMRRAGWGVWLALGLEDSYEELPSSLLEELQRDCRWCRGNIQHLQLMFMSGITFGHRFLFFNGNMFYFSALLWFMMLLSMTAYAIGDSFRQLQYFPMPHQLFPDWPLQYRHLSMELLGLTMVFLFLPKILSIVWVLSSGRELLFGGPLRLVLSVAAETIFSTILAPVRMVFHSRFVVTSLLGKQCDWKKQPHRTKQIGLKETFRCFWQVSAAALVWALIALAVNQTLFWWLSIIIIPLILSVPVCLLMSWPAADLFFKQCGLFVTPVDIQPSPEVMALKNLLS